MTHLLRCRAAAVAGFVLATSMLPAAAQTLPTKPVPFKAVFGITETVAFTLTSPCFAIGMLTGTGFATLLGQTQGVSTDCINTVGPYDPNAPMAYRFVSMAQGLVLQGQGGQLILNYSGTLTPETGAPHRMEGHFVIVGGTGRYVGAVGGGTFSGYEDIRSGTLGKGHVQFDGTVSMN